MNYEWEDRHLTPNGWIEGSQKRGIEPTELRVVPVDAVQTVRRWVATSRADKRQTKTNDITDLADRESILHLRAKFGEPVFGI
jgi:hypothetical protein